MLSLPSPSTSLLKKEFMHTSGTLVFCICCPGMPLDFLSGPSGQWGYIPGSYRTVTNREIDLNWLPCTLAQPRDSGLKYTPSLSVEDVY